MVSFSALLYVVVLGSGFFFSWSLDWLARSESEDFRVEAELNSGVVLLRNVFPHGFLSLLILLGFENGKLFLLKPFSIDFSSNLSSLLDGGVDLDTFTLVVLD